MCWILGPTIQNIIIYSLNSKNGCFAIKNLQLNFSFALICPDLYKCPDIFQYSSLFITDLYTVFVLSPKIKGIIQDQRLFSLTVRLLLRRQRDQVQSNKIAILVHDFLPNCMIFFDLSSSWLSDLYITKICVFC